MKFHVDIAKMLGLRSFKYSRLPRNSTDFGQDFEDHKLQNPGYSHQIAHYPRMLWAWLCLVFAVIVASNYVTIHIVRVMQSSQIDQTYLEHTSTYCLSTAHAYIQSDAHALRSSIFSTYVSEA